MTPSIATIVVSVLNLIAGTGVFVTACETISADMQALFSRRTVFPVRLSRSKLAGLGLGTLATAAVQSSSAVSVMVIGLVDAGAIELTQAATVIFGANIGTTVTGQLAAIGVSSGFAVPPAVLFSALAGIGCAIKALGKTERTKRVGSLICAFGMIFIGLTLMSDSAQSFSQFETVKSMLATFRSPLMLVVIGGIITACIQSSSVMTTIAVTCVATGMISLDQGIYLSIGANVGTTATALFAALPCGTNAKRIALLHTLFNAGGAVLFLIIGGILALCGKNYAIILSSLFGTPQLSLAMFHTVFNIITAFIALPLTNKLVRITTRLIPDKSKRAVAQSDSPKHNSNKNPNS